MAWSLADALGQDGARAELGRELAADRLAHAYMFEGQEGTGKLTLARGLAAARLCLNPGAGTGDACGACRSCALLAHGNHPDYLELPREPAELRIARFVERQGGEPAEHQPLLSFLRLRPVEGACRVAVIPDAERIRPEAANAFLKTLEEPPGASLTVLTVAARDRLPATVSSRCRRLGVRPLPGGVVAAELARRGIASGEAAASLALAAEGSLGRALALAGDGTPAFWRWLEEEGLSRPGPASARRLADAWIGFGSGGGDNAAKRKNAVAALDLTALVVRRRLRAGLDAGRGGKALAALWKAGERLARNVKPDLVLLSAAFDVMAALK